MAADRKLRKQLLEVGPYCMAEGGGVAICSPNATRTQRSGMYDLRYMARDDRLYWCGNFSSLDTPFTQYTSTHPLHNCFLSRFLGAQRVPVCARAPRARVGRRH